MIVLPIGRHGAGAQYREHAGTQWHIVRRWIPRARSFFLRLFGAQLSECYMF